MNCVMEDRSGCEWPDARDAVTSYCFGEAGEEARDRFEEHLLGCPECWREVQRLDAIIQTIHRDRTVTRRFDPEIATTIGISSRLRKAFGGHALHAVTASVMYASMLAVSVVMEIAYEYDRHAGFAWLAAPLVFAGALGCTLTALVADSVLTRNRLRSGLFASIGILLLAGILHYLLVRPFFPDRPVTQAAFQTWTAQAAYLKGIIYCGASATVFLLIPFHFIVSMQSELQAGRHRTVWDILTGTALAILPRGAPYIRVAILAALLLAGAGVSVLSTAHLLEALNVTEFTNLFIHTVQIRWLLFLGLGAECCWWYSSAINELKREARTASGT
jgi:hypothetical protein